MARRRTTDADPPSGDEGPRDAALVEFSKRLQTAVAEKGWNASELARQASLHMPGGKMPRDNVSNYLRARSLPGPVRLHALCQALHCKPDELLPSRGIPAAGQDNPPVDLRAMSDGKVWLRINQAVGWEQAIKVIELLTGARGYGPEGGPLPAAPQKREG